MKSIWKIIKIILVFFLALAIIAVAWYAIEVAALGRDETAVPFIDFILYLLGFGDLDSKDHYLQTAFSTLGLFAVTLLSSVFTVNLFEMRTKIKINSKIIIKNKHQAKLELKAGGTDIYDLTATLISKCGQDVTAEEQLFPFIAKKSSQELIFDIEPGTAIYKYLRAVFLKTEEEPQLILTVTYTDIESGQEYSMAQKYQYSSAEKKQIIFSGNDSENHSDGFETLVCNAIKNNTFVINLSSVWPCEADDIDLSYGYQDSKLKLSHKQAFCADIHMNSSKTYSPRTFTMAVTSDLLGSDWTTFYDLGCALRFDYKVEGDIAVTMELKCGAEKNVKKEYMLHPRSTFQTYSLSLHKFNFEDLKNVSELCFTVFYKDVDPDNPVGRFMIKNCALEVEG